MLNIYALNKSKLIHCTQSILCLIFNFQNYDALNTQLSSETAQLQAEYVETEKEVKKLEQKWQDLKLEYDRAEMLLEKARQESEDSPPRNADGKSSTLRETLTMQLREQENIFAKLKNVKKSFSNFNMILSI